MIDAGNPRVIRTPDRRLRVFVSSHAKRVTPRIEAVVEAGYERAGKS